MESNGVFMVFDLYNRHLFVGNIHKVFRMESCGVPCKKNSHVYFPMEIPRGIKP